MEESILEEWRDVVGYEGLYQVSSLGRVRSHYGGKTRYLKGSKNKIGYIQVGLYKNGKMKTCNIHRIVYTSFVGDIPENRQLDHIDGDKTNNALSNLRAVTPRENQWNPVTRVRYLEAMKKLYSSEQWYNTMRDAVMKVCAKPIVQLDAETGEVIREWQCMADIERVLGISHGNISQCCYGKRKTAAGYRWKFA